MVKYLEEYLFSHWGEFGLSEKPCVMKAEKRADWRFLLPLSRDARILELAGIGDPYSVYLAHCYGEVVLLDACYERAKLLHLRKTQEKIRSLSLVCGCPSRFLPFTQGTFDLVVMSRVLQWAPTVEPGDPKRIQENLLSETFRVLRRNGILYIEVENRFGYPFLLGTPDPHSGLRWGNVLPRKVANMVSKLCRGEEFRTYTHSYWALRRMLEKAGFSAIQFYTPYSHPDDLEKFYPLDDLAVLKRWIFVLEEGRRFRDKRKRLLFQLMAKLGVFRVLASHYGVVATR